MKNEEMTMRAYLDDSERWARHTPASRVVPGVEAQEIWPEVNLELVEREHFLARHDQLRRLCQLTFADIHRNFTDSNDLLVLTDVEGRLICLHGSHVLLPKGLLVQRSGLEMSRAQLGRETLHGGQDAIV